MNELFIGVISIGRNWFDDAILIFLVWGLWHGIRRGLSNLALTTIGSLLVLAATVTLYQTIYEWLQQRQWFSSNANGPAAIVAIAIGGYLPILIIRWVLGRWLQRHRFPILLEKFGGGILGLVSTAALLAWLNLGLMLTCNQTVQHKFIDDSWIASRLVRHLPVPLLTTPPDQPQPLPRP